MRQKYTHGLRRAAGTLASALAATCASGLPAWAQQSGQPDGSGQNMQRVEITGSSIRRIAQEGRLPLQVLTQDDIRKSGASSATDLIQMLPAMQGFIPASSSVNGGGAGVATAALHSLPSKYTLVLLDGQRIAPTALSASLGGGYAVNLESIPLTAVERVEILTDGASALYGSDAIAGVVNFILKKNLTGGEAFLTLDQPEQSGGRISTVGITKGWGDIDKDRYNVLFAYSHDEQQRLTALQRDFSAQGAFLRFSSGGQNYYFDQRTSNTEPANVTFLARPRGSSSAPVSVALNPYYSSRGNCGNPLAGVTVTPDGVSCLFNYAATVENIPGYHRDNGLLKGSWQITPTTLLWGEAVISSFFMTAQYAPSAQPMGVNTTSRFPALYNRYVQPYLNANRLENPAGTATLGYRSVLVGGRADEYVSDARHLAGGIEGTNFGWTYNAGVILSYSKIKDNAAGGYTDYSQLSALVAAGVYDPVLGTGAEALRPALLNGVNFSTAVSRLNTVHAGAQHDLFAMGGGPSIISVGGDYSKTHYQIGYHPLILSQSGYVTQPLSDDYPVGGNYGQVPFDARRDNWALSTELLLPLAKRLESTLSARYDRYDKTHSKYVFAPSADASGLQQRLPEADLGNTASASTYKATVRWTPVDALLVRGAVGTGFKAPNINDIAGANTFNGSTQGSYACPFPGSAGCRSVNAQYDLLIGPNGASGAAGLQPEKSREWTAGLRIEPLRGLSLGLDMWNVRIKNQVLSAGTPEQEGFLHPQQHLNLFVNPYLDPAGFTTIAYLQAPVNGGVANYRGVDWDFSYRGKSRIGDLRAAWNGTYMLKQNYTVAAGGPVYSDLGQFGYDNAVVFRVQSHLILSLVNGALTNTVTANYKSGYRDEAYPINTSVFAVNPDGSEGPSVAFAGLTTPSYTTFDWQGKYDFGKFALTAGVKNLFDRRPPFTLQNAGGGNQLGYDGRYADPRGRAYYLSGNVRF